MIKALHGASTFHSNVLSDVEIAHQTGYQGVEFFIDKLLRYLDNGGRATSLKQRLDTHQLQTTCINALMGVDRHTPQDRDSLISEARRITEVANQLECPTVQLNPGHYADHLSQAQRLDIITENIGEIAQLGEQYGIRYQIEFVASSEFNTLPMALDVIDRLATTNVGLVMDFWHLYARGVSTPQDVASLDPALIYGVHFCDGRKPRAGEDWDETVLRAYMPGEGEIDIQAFVDAVKSTGYNGAWSPELISPSHWEYEHSDIAKACFHNMSHFID
ncbi:sugar phosphate isomerase/epimerase family protein [Vibrio olivae]|uniref:Sugar phosphate isomerase/epimerase family protein n=1 Tax=Vibrio olivae TaxID=1243002 RepID=A0ABV5HHH0_9VIBR